MGLDHYAVNVADLQRAADWYQRILGFNVLHKWQTTWMVGKDNIKVGLFLRPDAKPPSDPDKELLIQHVAFLLDGDKFDAALKELADKGVQVDGPEDTGIAYSAFSTMPMAICSRLRPIIHCRPPHRLLRRPPRQQQPRDRTAPTHDECSDPAGSRRIHRVACELPFEKPQPTR